MELTNVNAVIRHFIYTLIVFVALSVLLDGGPDLIHNAILAVGFTALMTIRDSLAPVRRRIFNLVMYGFVVVVMLLSMFLLDNANSEFILEVAATLYCTYRFYTVYEEKP